MFDYQCYPIGIYDENGDFIDNDLVAEIEKDDNMITMLEERQDMYDSLYLNNKEEFKYIGFNSDIDKRKFEEKVQYYYYLNYLFSVVSLQKNSFAQRKSTINTKNNNI